MRIEFVPLVLAAIFGLIAVGLIADAWLPEEYYVTRERRRRRRTERHRGGEVLVGAGILALAAALAGRASWRYGTVAIMVGALLLLVGAALNHRYLRELFSFRGAARRADPAPAPLPTDDDQPEPRIRLR
jgi:hypothetical protein